jgi:hypothetical protein
LELPVSAAALARSSGESAIPALAADAATIKLRLEMVIDRSPGIIVNKNDRITENSRRSTTVVIKFMLARISLCTLPQHS